MAVSFSSSSLSNDFNKYHVITCPSDQCAVSDEEDGGRRQMALSVAAYFSGRSADFIILAVKIITSAPSQLELDAQGVFVAYQGRS